ncbi:MAG TPA: hypothetical protein VF960_02420, partial [Chloroflexota bacterium]
MSFVCTLAFESLNLLAHQTDVVMRLIGRSGTERKADTVCHSKRRGPALAGPLAPAACLGSGQEVLPRQLVPPLPGQRPGDPVDRGAAV